MKRKDHEEIMKILNYFLKINEIDNKIMFNKQLQKLLQLANKNNYKFTDDLKSLMKNVTEKMIRLNQTNELPDSVFIPFALTATEINEECL